MPSENLPNTYQMLPEDQTSIFKKFVMAQDEVPASHSERAAGNSEKQQTGYTRKIVQSGLDFKGAERKSIFSGHSLAAGEHDIPLHESNAAGWILFILIPLLFLAVIIRMFYHNRFSQIFKAFLAPRFMNQLMRDGNLMNERITPPLLILYFTSTALFIFQWLKLSGIMFTFNGADHLIFSGLFGAVAGFFFLRIAMVRLIGWIFKTGAQSQTYIVNALVFNGAIGYAMLPATLIILYAGEPFRTYIGYFALLILAIAILYGYIRSFMIGMQIRKYSWLYLFLYLCTVEFLPVLVIGKITYNYFILY